MSKTLRKVLVSSAALLIMASTGVASAGNVNINAKRRHHRRSSLVVHTHKNRSPRHKSKHKTYVKQLPTLTQKSNHHKNKKSSHKRSRKSRKKSKKSKATQQTSTQPSYDSSKGYWADGIPLEVTTTQTPSDEQNYLNEVNKNPEITPANKKLINQLYAGPSQDSSTSHSNSKKQKVAEDDDGATGDLVYDDGNGGSDSNPYSDDTQASDTTPSDTNSDTNSDTSSDAPSDTSSDTSNNNQSNQETAQENQENAVEEAQEQADEKIDQEREQQQAAQEEAAQKAQEAQEQAEQKLEEQNQKLDAARAAAQISPSQAYTQAQQGHESSQDEKLAAARDAANNEVNNAISPMSAVKAVEQKKGQSHSQKLVLAREDAKLNKQASAMTQQNIDNDIKLLIARGDFNGLNHQDCMNKINYLEQHPNAVMSLIHNNNLGAVVYAKDPQAAVNFARKAAKKHPELKHKKILATNSKTEANKLALLQADFNKLAKQQGIKLPKGSVFVINAQ